MLQFIRLCPLVGPRVDLLGFFYGLKFMVGNNDDNRLMHIKKLEDANNFTT